MGAFSRITILSWLFSGKDILIQEKKNPGTEVTFKTQSHMSKAPGKKWQVIQDIIFKY